MAAEFSGFVDDRTSEHDTVIEGITPDMFSPHITDGHEARPDYGLVFDPDAVPYGHEDTPAATMRYLNAYTMGTGQQFEQTFSTNDDLVINYPVSSLLGLEPPHPCSTESPMGKTTVGTALHSFTDYQPQQHREEHPYWNIYSKPPIDIPQVAEYSDNDEVAKGSRPLLEGARGVPLRLRGGSHKRINRFDNQCAFCEQIFTRRDNIKPHVRRKHPRQYDLCYPISPSTSKSSSPAPVTRHLSAHGEPLATHDLENGGCTNRSNLIPLELGGQTPSLAQAIVPLSGGSTVPRKRSCDSFSGEDPDTLNGSGRRLAPRLSSGGNDQGSVLFACPFQKRNARRYQKCFALSLQRIKDVKQHIYRCHSKPQYYCATCYAIFDTPKDRDEHSRQRRCKETDSPSLPKFEGITEDQRKQLSEKSPRTVGVEAQWFQIWSILFPDDVRPKSVYLGNCLEEMVPLLREEWECHGPKITANALGVDAHQLSCAMDIFFQCLEGEMAGHEMGENRAAPWVA